MLKMKKAATRLVRGGRSGRRIYGGIYTLSDGREIYLAFRNRKEIFRDGEKSVSTAVEKGCASWAMDYDTLYSLRNDKVDIVGVYVRDDKAIYITALGNFLDTTKATMKNYDSRGGALQRYLPLQYFRVIRKASKI